MRRFADILVTIYTKTAVLSFPQNSLLSLVSNATDKDCVNILLHLQFFYACFSISERVLYLYCVSWKVYRAILPKLLTF